MSSSYTDLALSATRASFQTSPTPTGTTSAGEGSNTGSAYLRSMATGFGPVRQNDIQSNRRPVLGDPLTTGTTDTTIVGAGDNPSGLSTFEQSIIDCMGIASEYNRLAAAAAGDITSLNAERDEISKIMTALDALLAENKDKNDFVIPDLTGADMARISKHICPVPCSKDYTENGVRLFKMNREQVNNLRTSLSRKLETIGTNVSMKMIDVNRNNDQVRQTFNIINDLIKRMAEGLKKAISN